MLRSLFQKLAGPFLIEEDLKLKSLDEIRLKDLFKTLTVESVSYVEIARTRTNRLSVWLMDLAGNPWEPTIKKNPVCIAERSLFRQSIGIFFKKPAQKSLFG